MNYTFRSCDRVSVVIGKIATGTPPPESSVQVRKNAALTSRLPLFLLVPRPASRAVDEMDRPLKRMKGLSADSRNSYDRLGIEIHSASSRLGLETGVNELLITPSFQNTDEMEVSAFLLINNCLSILRDGFGMKFF